MVAGGGIAETNVGSVIRMTGVREVHASVRVPVPSPMRHRNEKISMGAIKGREYHRVVVVQDRVRRLLEAMVNGTRRGVKAR